MRHPSCTMSLDKPKNWDQVAPGAECHSLPVAPVIEDGVQTLQSFWRPSVTEMDMICRGRGYVRLTMVGAQHPPVRIDVVPHEDEGKDK